MIESYVGPFYRLYKVVEINVTFYVIYIIKLSLIHYLLRFFQKVSYKKYHTKTVLYLEVSSILATSKTIFIA
jgi:hypothetical protein